jgi:hypothetical protein
VQTHLEKLVKLTREQALQARLRFHQRRSVSSLIHFAKMIRAQVTAMLHLRFVLLERLFRLPTKDKPEAVEFLEAVKVAQDPLRWTEMDFSVFGGKFSSEPYISISTLVTGLMSGLHDGILAAGVNSGEKAGEALQVSMLLRSVHRYIQSQVSPAAGGPRARRETDESSHSHMDHGDLAPSAASPHPRDKRGTRGAAHEERTVIGRGRGRP